MIETKKKILNQLEMISKGFFLLIKNPKEKKPAAFLFVSEYNCKKERAEEGKKLKPLIPFLFKEIEINRGKSPKLLPPFPYFRIRRTRGKERGDGLISLN